MKDRMSAAYSLLDESLFSVQMRDGTVKTLSLPEIFETLVHDRVLGFKALQPHQQQPWFCFLVQAAAMAVARYNDGTIPEAASHWRKLLVELSEGSEEAWCLVVEDVSKPAFMQTPIPEGSSEQAKYSSDIETPDDLDMLLTSKNHDVKSSRILCPEIENWLFALITLQTMEGFLGRGNYGIIRMNGGFGNRPFVGISKGISWGNAFRRDATALLNTRDDYSNSYELNGIALLWLNSWDGTDESSVRLSDCDPYFIEICRRIRFGNEDGLRCYRSNTKSTRIKAPDDIYGKTGDPWTPIEKKGAKALTLGENGFTFELLQNIFLGNEYDQPLSMQFQEDEKDGAILVARALIRGQGKTDGLHKRTIPIPRKVATRLFRDPSEKEKLSIISQKRVRLTASVQKKVLYPAIASLIGGGTKDKVDYDDVKPWIDRFNKVVDAHFFDYLWDAVDQEEKKVERRWEEFLRTEAEKIYLRAEKGTPIPSAHHWRAVSKGRSIFYSSLRKHFKHVMQPEVSEK